ncbi:MAG: hypothetical protein N3I86_02375 [Verrucomicrobiae bacterium]|nr:hypothetical protein [Verrucomicrobiae bacterium]
MYKALDLWLPAYLSRPRRPLPDGTLDLLFAVCDHFEPRHDADPATARERVRRWQQIWPALIAPFRDADGVPPRHTFFYPIEQYDPELLSPLTELCSATGAEVEVHLHHDQDSATGLRARLERGKADLARHGLLSRDAHGNPRFGFIHGNWALDHSHPQGRHCGVPEELDVLLATGCYADFTMPSAPDPTQTRTINSLYYATENGLPKSHDSGCPARVRNRNADPPPNGLLCVQGPLALNWQRRKFGLLPRIENGALTGANPPRPDRMRLWVRLHIHVAGQPNWLFIKLHTHGGVPRNMLTLLGEPMCRFWEHALTHYNDGRRFRLHFVTAREMVNILHAAEDGHTGNPGHFRNYRFEPPPVLARSSTSAPPPP